METTHLMLTGAGVVALLLALRTLSAHRSGLSREEIQALMEQGAMILDVRTPGEFSRGHAPGSRNVPLDRLPSQMGTLDRSQPILVCCASGTRSAAAKAMLDKAGFTRVRNAGSWQRVLL